MKKTCLYFLCLLAFSACGSNGSDSREVTRVRFLADDIELNESVRVEVEFTTGSDDFGDVRATTLSFEISSALNFVPGSIELFEGNNDDTDLILPSQVLACSDGRTLIRLFLDRDDLRNNSFAGEFKLKLNVSGKTASALATVSANASKEDSISCEQDFLAEDSDAVEIG